MTSKRPAKDSSRKKALAREIRVEHDGALTIRVGGTLARK